MVMDKRIGRVRPRLYQTRRNDGWSIDPRTVVEDGAPMDGGRPCRATEPPPQGNHYPPRTPL